MAEMSAPSSATERRLPAWPVTLIATSFGAGFSPVAPGTMGTLTAVPMAWALARLGTLGFAGATAGITVLGIFAAGAFVRATGREDDQRIVVDEVAGYLVTLLPVARTPLHLALAFGLFRLFDIWKPPPVRWIDDHVRGGLGVMADDLAAGVYGAAVLFALDRFGVVARLAGLVHA
jgi:phosphatidylglycerophosphatase A